MLHGAEFNPFYNDPWTDVRYKYEVCATANGSQSSHAVAPPGVTKSQSAASSLALRQEIEQLKHELSETMTPEEQEGFELRSEVDILRLSVASSRGMWV